MVLYQNVRAARVETAVENCKGYQSNQSRSRMPTPAHLAAFATLLLGSALARDEIAVVWCLPVHS
jgi:hypothetical protein